MKIKSTAIICVLIGICSSLYASEADKYIGKWESRDGSRQFTLKSNMHCIFKKNSKIILKENVCKWDAKTPAMIYYFNKQEKKNEKIYFKLDNNELIFEQDLVSLTREKADMIMHKI
jgi:hypothetical protein